MTAGKVGLDTNEGTRNSAIVLLLKKSKYRAVNVKVTGVNIGKPTTSNVIWSSSIPIDSTVKGEIVTLPTDVDP